MLPNPQVTVKAVVCFLGTSPVEDTATRAAYKNGNVYLPLLYHNAKLIDRWVATGLYEAGIVRSKKPRSYLPAIILAFTEES
jgi:hypothetical protein